jgi:hypothetical protein
MLDLGRSLSVGALVLVVGCGGERPDVVPDSGAGAGIEAGAQPQDHGAVPPAGDAGLDQPAVGPEPDGTKHAADTGAGCPTIPPGTYKGNIAGAYSGTISFKLAAGATGPVLVEQGSKLEAKATYPIVMGSITCGKLHAALARPPGSSGGTDLRGTIDGTFVAPSSFKGTWNLPGNASGTFKANLVP